MILSDMQGWAWAHLKAIFIKYGRRDYCPFNSLRATLLPPFADILAASSISMTLLLFQGGQVGWRYRDFSLHHHFRVGKRIVEKRIGRFRFLGDSVLLRTHDFQVAAVGADDITVFAVHFQILPVVIPVPTDLQNSLGFNIGENHGSHVVYFWIEMRFDVLGDGHDGFRFQAIHQPSTQVGALTSEISERAAAVQHRVGQLFQKFRVAADFVGAGMTASHHDLSDRAEGLHFRFDELFSFMITTLPADVINGQRADALRSALFHQAVNRQCTCDKSSSPRQGLPV